MTVRYSHEAWGRVVSAGEDASVLRKNVSILMPKGEFKLDLNPNPARLYSVRGGGGAHACVANQA